MFYFKFFSLHSRILVNLFTLGMPTTNQRSFVQKELFCTIGNYTFKHCPKTIFTTSDIYIRKRISLQQNLLHHKTYLL